MKVREDRSAVQNVVPGQSARRKEAAANAASFDNVLHEQNLSGRREALNGLLEKVAAQGEIVARRRNIDDVRRYRELVSDFLDTAMRSTYERNKENAFDARGRYKEYAIVKKIDAGLEELTRTVLDEQKDNLSILEQLGTIRGLLLDLLI